MAFLRLNSSSNGLLASEVCGDRKVLFSDLRLSVGINGSYEEIPDWKKSACGNYSASVAGMEISIETRCASEAAPYHWIRAVLVNKSGKDIRFDGFRFSQNESYGEDDCLAVPAQKLSLFREGWTMASASSSVRYGEKDFESNPDYKRFAVSSPSTYDSETPNRFSGEHVIIFNNSETGHAVLAGFISSANHVTDFQVNMDNGKVTRINMFSRADGILVENGEESVSEELVIISGNDGYGLLEEFGELWGKRMKALTWTHTPAGWCSWYHYFSEVTEEDILENIRFAKENKEDYPIEYIQLDDGYQHALGDWLTCNEKFPHGLEFLAQEIRKAGCKAGLWLAPFMVEERSEFYKAHSDWMVKDSKGETVWVSEWRGSRVAVPDASRTEIQDWLRSIFSSLVKYGYDYVKLDFMVYECAVTTMGGVYHNPKYTRAMALRSGVQAIRDAMGDLFMLGCTTPLGPVAGIVNAERISTDITPYWQGEGKIYKEAPTVPNVCRNIIHRSYMHKRLWLSDPDVLIVRDSNTKLTENEVIVWTTALWLAGGLCLSGDRLCELKPERAKLAKLLMKSVDSFKQLRPLDIFEREYPALWSGIKQGSEEHVVGVFNFTDKAEAYTIELGKAGIPAGKTVNVYEFWTESCLGNVSDRMTLEVQPHCCKLLFFK